MKTKIIIPSRLGSTRFPNKPLAKIDGLEMIVHVCRRASAAYPVIVVTPDIEIADLVKQHGYKALLTSHDCETGTDRLAEVAPGLDADIFVNVQGDEPLILPDDINRVVLAKKLWYNQVIGSMAILTENNSNIVKVHQQDGKLISMSRCGQSKYKQCGLYAFNRGELLAFHAMSKNEKLQSLKNYENIEIMRFIDLGIPVFMQLIKGSPSVDVPNDINKILEVISNG